MNTVQRLLEATLTSGELDRQLTVQHRRWQGILDFDDFREAVLARAWERRQQFRGNSPEEFLAWLRRLGWSIGIDHWRERRRERSLLQRFAELIPQSTGSPTGIVDTRELVEWLLAGLNDRERKVLTLKYYQQLSGEEIARTLGTSVAAVHQLHYRALGKLRDRLKKSDQDR
jgi:RNA polymerase sigma factor (sigma-70 family)